MVRQSDRCRRHLVNGAVAEVDVRRVEFQVGGGDNRMNRVLHRTRLHIADRPTTASVTRTSSECR